LFLWRNQDFLFQQKLDHSVQIFLDRQLQRFQICLSALESLDLFDLFISLQSAIEVLQKHLHESKPQQMEHLVVFCGIWVQTLCELDEDVSERVYTDLARGYDPFEVLSVDWQLQLKHQIYEQMSIVCLCHLALA
jgi:uncharacterized protein YjaG (DUF416 family)